MPDCCANPDVRPIANSRDPDGTIHGYMCQNCGYVPNRSTLAKAVMKTGRATWEGATIPSLIRTDNWRVTKPGHQLDKSTDKMYARTGDGPTFYLRINLRDAELLAELRELHTMQGRVYGQTTLSPGEEGWATVYDYMAALNDYDRDDVIEVAEEAAEERQRRKEEWIESAFEVGAEAYEENWGDDPFEVASTEEEARKLIRLNWDDSDVRGTDDDEDLARAVNGPLENYTLFDHIEEVLMDD